ncbi:MAG: hypothetical protein HFH85_10610 [Lachnospiraceae bacterium]|jgi:hypothetical protein|nr:hypothetical protein [Lachnospiraceae bacterium]
MKKQETMVKYVHIPERKRPDGHYAMCAALHMVKYVHIPERKRPDGHYAMCAALHMVKYNHGLPVFPLWKKKTGQEGHIEEELWQYKIHFRRKKLSRRLQMV